MDISDHKSECSPSVHTGTKNLDPDLYAEHSRLYKKPTRTLASQSERRAQLLSELKERRHNELCLKRGLEELFNQAVKETHVKPRKIKSNLFRNKLMLSEWFSEIPDDLEQNWVVKLCPRGVRNIVVAHNHITKAYNKKGEQQCVFKSLLPGGGSSNCHYKVFTVLDCIYNVKNRTYYVLDVIAWRSHSLKDCDTEFRFYWLQSKFMEEPNLATVSTINQYRFVAINSFPSELPLIEDKLSVPYNVNEEQLQLDGVLFYHKAINYQEGRNPFVGWLKPYMIPEVISVPVHEAYVLLKPENYVTLQHYLHEIQKKIEEKKSKRVENEMMEQ